MLYRILHVIQTVKKGIPATIAKEKSIEITNTSTEVQINSRSDNSLTSTESTKHKVSSVCTSVTDQKIY